MWKIGLKNKTDIETNKGEQRKRNLKDSVVTENQNPRKMGSLV